MKMEISHGDENERQLPTQAHMNGTQRMNDDRRHANAEVDLGARRDAAMKNGDEPTARDCSFRIQHADARKEAGRAQDNMNRAKESGDNETLAEATKAKEFQTRRIDLAKRGHEELRKETQAHTGRKLNSIDQPQGEDPAAYDRWDQRESAKVRARQETEQARANGEQTGAERRGSRSHVVQGYQPRPADFQQRAANLDKMAEARKAQPPEQDRKQGMSPR